MKGVGGKLGIITGYAPHNLKPYDERHNFYVQLNTLWEKTCVNGSKFIVGDLNARIGLCRAGEEQVFGQFGFCREAVHRVEATNRDILFEFCIEMWYTVRNVPPDS